MLLILAVVVGTLAGLATYIFELLLHLIKEGLVNWFDTETYHFLYLV
jgi:CIC family chloride channel protein